MITRILIDLICIILCGMIGAGAVFLAVVADDHPSIMAQWNAFEEGRGR